MLGAWALRTHHLGALSLWLDEGYSYDVARRGARAVLALLPAEDRHPPLHYLLLWLTMRAAGTSEYALRLLSAMAGTLLVALAHRLGRQLGGAWLGLAGAGLVAASPFLVWYSQEARMYALLAALGAASFLCWLRMLERRDQVALVGYVVATVAALYTHYYAVFLLPAELVALALGRRWRWRPVAAMAAACVLFAPWLPAIVQQGGHGSGGYQPDTPLAVVVGGLAAAYPLGDSFPQPAALVVLFGVLAVVGAVLAPRRVGLTLAAWCLLAPLAAYGLSVAAGIELRATGRMYYLAGAPAYLLLVGRGLTMLARPGWRGALAGLLGVGLIGAQGWALRDQFVGRAKEDWRGAAAMVAAHRWPGDAVVWVAEPLFRGEPWRYYYRGDAPLEVADPRSADLDARLSELARAHPRLWLLLVHGQIADPTNRVETWLDDRLTPLADYPDPDVHLRLYSSEPRPNTQTPPVARPIGATLGGAVELVGAGGDRDAGERGLLRVEVVWRALRALDQSYHAALVLMDGAGQVRAQVDRVALSPLYDSTHWRPGEYLTDRYDLPLPADLPAGGYSLRLHLYAPATGQTLRPAGGGDLVDLGAVRVGPRRFDVPQMTRTSGARLGDAAELLGYDLPDGGQAAPGGVLELRLWWRALRELPRDYTVFTHLVGDGGQLRGQHDGPPVGGTYPTTLWAPGEVVGDEHELRVDPAAAPGQYVIEVGMYLPDTGQRLGDAVRLGDPVVIRAGT